MTINLSQFPKKIFEDVYLTKTIVRKMEATGQGRTRPKRTLLLIPKLAAEEQKIAPGSYICKIKRLSDAYTEEELLLNFECDGSNPEYPYAAQFPDETGFKDAESVYFKAEAFDLGKWFKSKRSKGFDAMTSYEEGSE